MGCMYLRSFRRRLPVAKTHPMPQLDCRRCPMTAGVGLHSSTAGITLSVLDAGVQGPLRVCSMMGTCGLHVHTPYHRLRKRAPPVIAPPTHSYGHVGMAMDGKRGTCSYVLVAIEKRAAQNDQANQRSHTRGPEPARPRVAPLTLATVPFTLRAHRINPGDFSLTSGGTFFVAADITTPKHPTPSPSFVCPRQPTTR